VRHGLLLDGRGAALQEELDDLEVDPVACVEQWGESALVYQVHVDTTVDEQPHRVEIATAARFVQRGASLFTSGIRRSTVFEEKLHHIEPTPATRDMQRSASTPGSLLPHSTVADEKPHDLEVTPLARKVQWGTHKTAVRRPAFVALEDDAQPIDTLHFVGVGTIIEKPFHTNEIAIDAHVNEA